MSSIKGSYEKVVIDAESLSTLQWRCCRFNEPSASSQYQTGKRTAFETLDDAVALIHIGFTLSVLNNSSIVLKKQRRQSFRGEGHEDRARVALLLGEERQTAAMVQMTVKS